MLNQISQAQPDEAVVSQIIPAGPHLSWTQIWVSGSARGSQFPTSGFDREAKQDKMLKTIWRAPERGPPHIFSINKDPQFVLVDCLVCVTIGLLEKGPILKAKRRHIATFCCKV